MNLLNNFNQFQHSSNCRSTNEILLTSCNFLLNSYYGTNHLEVIGKTYAKWQKRVIFSKISSKSRYLEGETGFLAGKELIVRCDITWRGYNHLGGRNFDQLGQKHAPMCMVLSIQTPIRSIWTNLRSIYRPAAHANMHGDDLSFKPNEEHKAVTQDTLPKLARNFLGWFFQNHLPSSGSSLASLGQFVPT